MTRGTRLALGAMAISVFVIANDVTALSVALPEIENDFDADVATVQWVINAYALVFGVLIVTGGRLADMLGRRRVFFIGAAVFAAFSLLAGAAQDELWLIGCRALMGIGGALMWPAVLGMTYDILPEDRAALAGALIIGSAGFGNAAGPLLGGFLTDVLSWRWIMFVNIPIAGLACFVTWRSVRESRGAGADEGIDVPGVATLSTGLVALLLALDQVTDWGWSDPRILGLFAGCAVLLVAFVAIERRAGARALVPREVMSNPAFRSACLATLLMSAVFFAVLLFLPQFMQKILGWDPLEAGAGLLPLMGVFAVTSFAAGPLYERLGAKTVVSAGAACLALGTFLISLVGRDSGWGELVPGMVVTGVGVGLFYSSITTAAVTALDPSRSSLAGGIVYMFQVAGGSVGLGLTTTVFTTASQDKLQSASTGLSEGEVENVQGVLAGTESAAEVIARQGGATAERLVELVRESFVSGLVWSFRLVAVLAFAGLMVSVLFVGGSLVGRPREAAPRAPAG
ncbi:MAG: MFS transporter [Thermoleophilaceae bacterium]|nr:MFS transporter [Thermoleophilaceae bacterium]